MKLKRICSFLLSVILLVVMFSVPAAAENNTPKHIPRIVSIVFDDSGSMYDKVARWAYASYAMQSFCAMMGESDELYVTYLNASDKKQTVKLDKSMKQAEIDKFAKIMYGGTTPCKVQQAAEILVNRYKKVGSNAMYFLIVLADGELDDKTTTLTAEIEKTKKQTMKTIPATDFSCRFFNMKDDDGEKESQIIDDLREYCAEIMGRKEIPFRLNAGELSFEIGYPAFSIVVFAQAANKDFSKTTISAKHKEGQAISDISSFRVKCPTKIVKNPDRTQHQPIRPTNPPAGMVSILTNGDAPLKKGAYTVKLSVEDLKNENVAVLIEPAVCIGCNYFINDDEKAHTFEEAAKALRVGDKLTVQCGLFEINEDGSVGAQVPEKLLDPNYTVFVNDKKLSKSSSSRENAFELVVDETHSNGELKVQATIEGFAPFTDRHSFGKIKKIGVFDAQNKGKTETLQVTQSVFSKMKTGEQKLQFPFSKIDKDVLREYEIKSSWDAFVNGNCAEQKGAVKVSGNALELSPFVKNDVLFADFPEKSTIELLEKETGDVLYTFILEKQDTAYRIETENPFDGQKLSLPELLKNEQAITFTVTADYEGKGVFGPLDESDKAGNIDIQVDPGKLPGQLKAETGFASFVPFCENETELSKLTADTYKISAKAKVNGKDLQAEDVVLQFSQASYRLEVESQIKAPMTLDELQKNSKKVIFKLLADYDGDGQFVPLEPWDSAKYEQLKISSGVLPGKTAAEKDLMGSMNGIAFIPQYDETKMKDLPYTAIVAKTHEITAVLEGTDLTAAASVEVSSPVFGIETMIDDYSVMDTALLGNTDGVGFVVTRDGKPLPKEALQALSPEISFEHGSWLSATTLVETEKGGRAYLKCVPVYGGPSLFSPKLWSWMSVVFVHHGRQTVELKIGENVGQAQITIERDFIVSLIALILLAVLLFLLYMAVCVITRPRFIKGHLYMYRMTAAVDGYTRYSVSRKKTNRSPTLLQFIKPRQPSQVRVGIPGAGIEVKLSTSRLPFGWRTRSAPVLYYKENERVASKILISSFDRNNWNNLLNETSGFSLMGQRPFKKDQQITMDCMYAHTALVVPDPAITGQIYVLVFIATNERKKILKNYSEKKRR